MFSAMTTIALAIVSPTQAYFQGPKQGANNWSFRDAFPIFTVIACFLMSLPCERCMSATGKRSPDLGSNGI